MKKVRPMTVWRDRVSINVITSSRSSERLCWGWGWSLRLGAGGFCGRGVHTAGTFLLQTDKPIIGRLDSGQRSPRSAVMTSKTLTAPGLAAQRADQRQWPTLCAAWRWSAGAVALARPEITHLCQKNPHLARPFDSKNIRFLCCSMC